MTATGILAQSSVETVFGNLMDGNPKVIHYRITKSGLIASHYVMLEKKSLAVIQFLNVAVYCMIEAITIKAAYMSEQ